MCCKNCKKREVGCHANCEEYKEFRKPFDRASEQRRNDGVLAEMDYLRGERIRKGTYRRRKRSD